MTAGQEACGPPIHAMSQYQNLVWEDHFDGPTLDYSKWECEINSFGGGNGELQMYTDSPRNVRVENSRLILEARREVTSFADTTRDFSSGRVRSKHRGDWTYGRFEVNAKLPYGCGLWPAIWMLPTDNHYGSWAASGEIDIMENKGQHPCTVTGALHFGGGWPDNKHIEFTSRRRSGHPSFAEAFHTYGVEWSPTGMQWAVDGHTTHAIAPGGWGVEEGTAPFDQRFHLLLNLAVGGSHPGSPDASTPFPARFEIDWVRVYQ